MRETLPIAGMTTSRTTRQPRMTLLLILAFPGPLARLAPMIIIMMGIMPPVHTDEKVSLCCTCQCQSTADRGLCRKQVCFVNLPLATIQVKVHLSPLSIPCCMQCSDTKRTIFVIFESRTFRSLRSHLLGFAKTV